MSFEKYENHLKFSNKAGRFLWGFCRLFFFRPFSLPIFNSWRLFILRIFGAKIGSGCKISSSVKVWAPWNLEIGQQTAIGPEAGCYSPGKIILGNKVVISQHAYLCTASHDYNKKENPLITRPIIVRDYAWIAAGAYIGMGVTIGEGAVVGARAVVTRDVMPWTVVAGNPAMFIKNRKLESK